MAINFNGIAFAGTEGLRARLEDGEGGNVDVDVNVNTPEAVEAENDASEATTEVAEAITESEVAESDAEQTQMLFEQLEAHHAYLQQYGWTKEFEMLANWDGKYDHFVRRAGYSSGMESLDDSNRPNATLTKIGQEGIADALSDFWEWIKEKCKQIFEWVKNLFTKIGFMFGSIESRITKARKLLKERDYDNEKADKSNARVPNTADVAKKYDEFWAKAKEYQADYETLFDRITFSLTTVISGGRNTAGIQNQSGMGVNGGGAVMGTTRSVKKVTRKINGEDRTVNYSEIDKDTRKDIKKLYDDLIKECKNDSTNIRDVNESTASSALDTAAKKVVERRQLDIATRFLEKATKEIQKLADDALRMQNGNTSAKSEFTKAMRSLLGNQSVHGWRLNGLKKMAEANLTVAVRYITQCTKSSS